MYHCVIVTVGKRYSLKPLMLARSLDSDSITVLVRVQRMPRKLVRVYLSREQKKLLEWYCKSLGVGESEALRDAFMDYTKSIGLVAEKVHGRI